jgi:hypothetical protein
MCKVNWEERVFLLAKDFYSSGNYSSIEGAINDAFEFKEIYLMVAKQFGECDDIEDKEKEKKKREKSFDPYEDLSYVEDKYLSLWKEWLDYKRQIKSQYKTQKGAKTQYTSWVNFSEGSLNLAKAIIKRSIENSWSGLFELSPKEKALYGSPRTPFGYVAEYEDLRKDKEDDKLFIGGVEYR